MKVYIAGKTRHAAFFAEVIQKMLPLGVTCTSRWIDHILNGQSETPENARRFWVEDEEDVRAADYTIVWATEGDTLRGALIEAGMAIAFGKKVIIIDRFGDNGGTWQYHPSVTRCNRLSDAFLILLADMQEQRNATRL